MRKKKSTEASKGSKTGLRAKALNAVQRNPWDQTEQETDLAYSLFCKYLTSPIAFTETGKERSRNLAEVARQNGYHREQLQRWSTEHSWQSREKAYDEFWKSPTGIEESIERRAVGVKIRSISNEMFDKVNAALAKLNVTNCTPGEIIALGKFALSLSKQADTIEEPITNRAMEVLENEIRTRCANIASAGFAASARRVGDVGPGPEATPVRRTGKAGSSGFYIDENGNLCSGVRAISEPPGDIHNESDGPNMDEGPALDSERDSFGLEEDSD